MKVPMPELAIRESFYMMEPCVGCRKWPQRGYFYGDLFICEDCSTDGDALAMLAWELLQIVQRSLVLTQEEATDLQNVLDETHLEGYLLDNIGDKLKSLISNYPVEAEEKNGAE